MKKSTCTTTTVLLLSDGTHHTSQWALGATSKEVWSDVRDVIKHLNDGVYVYEMFLASGMQSLRYTKGEVIELAEKYS